MKSYIQKKRTKIITTSLQLDKNNLRIGAFKIESIPLLQIFNPVLRFNEIITSYIPEELKLNNELMELAHTYLPKKVQSLKNDGKTVDFNDLYGIRSINFIRPQVDEERHNSIELLFEPTNYKYFLMINEALDVPLLKNHDNTLSTIRKRKELNNALLEWDSIKTIPIHMWAATVTCVVTADNFIIMPIRSSKQAIIGTNESNIEQVSMSCAEGMFRPADSTKNDLAHSPSPFLTSMRSIKDELNISPGTHFNLDQIELLGVGFDSNRFEPVFIFMLKLQSLTFNEVHAHWQSAKDRQEAKTLIPLEISEHSIIQLLKDQYKITNENGKVKPAILFSNHQKLGILVSALRLLPSHQSFIKQLGK